MNLITLGIKYGEKGIQCFNNGDYLTAIVNLNEALSFCGSDYPQYYKIRGLSHMHLGYYGAAIQDFSILIEYYKNELDYFEYFARRGSAYEKLGLLEMAEQDYAKALTHKSCNTTKKDFFLNIKNTHQQFLIIANPRTGSTWLELMLNCLPDVTADLEFKWSNQQNLIANVKDTLYPMLTGNIFSPTFSEALLLLNKSNITGFRAFFRALPFLSKRSITGSKLIIDFNAEHPDFEALRNKIDPDKIKIIHLTRNYHEIIESVGNGYYHVGNKENTGNKHSKLSSVLMSENNLLNVQMEKKHLNIDQSYLTNYLDALLNTDLFLKTFENKCQYIRVDYTEVNKRFYEIVKFIGSSAEKNLIEEILSNPPTKKVSQLLPERATIVDANLIELIDCYEQRRKTELIGTQI